MASPILTKVGETVFDHAGEYIASGERILRSMGPIGHSLADLLKSGQDRVATRTGKVAEFYIPRARPELTEEVVNDLERKTRATSKDGLELADYSRLLREHLYQEAQQVGIKVGPRVKDDFPHMWPKELFEGVSREKVIQHLQNSGQASSRHQAEFLIDEVLSRKGKVHTLESPRQINLPDYRRDLAVPFDHFQSSIRRIEWAKTFGPNHEKLDFILDNIAKDKGPAAFKLADTIASNFIGRNRPVTRPWYRKVASVEALEHLSLAFLRHSGQFLNTTVLASRSGLTPTVKAAYSMIADHGNAESFALKTGATLYKTAQDFRRIAGVETNETLGSKMLRYTPFSYIDQLRRTFAANVGGEFAQQQAEKLVANPKDIKAIRNLRLVGLDPTKIAQKGIQPDDLLTAGKRMSDMTQFESNALTLPPKFFSEEPLLRLAYMYKQFFFHQARFVKDQVLKPALLEGEMKPLIYMATLFPTFGEMVADVNEFARKGTLKERPQNVVERLIDNYAAIGGFGIIHDMVYAFASPQKDAAFRFLVGPAISDAVDIARIPGMKHPVEEVEKRLLRSVPLVGPIAQRKVFPPKNQVKGPLQKGVVTKEINKVFDLKLP